MVKPELLNLGIEIWIHPGKLGVSQPSLCLYHSSKKSGDQLLSILDEMQSEDCPSKHTLTFKPTDRHGTVTTLRLLQIAGYTDLRVMNIASETNVATIQMTAIGRDIIKSGILKWLDGAEDFCVSVRNSKLKPGQLGRLDRTSGELWFWGPTYIGP